METRRAEGVFKGAAAAAFSASAQQRRPERPVSIYPPRNALFSFLFL